MELKEAPFDGRLSPLMVLLEKQIYGTNCEYKIKTRRVMHILEILLNSYWKGFNG